MKRCRGFLFNTKLLKKQETSETLKKFFCSFFSTCFYFPKKYLIFQNFINLLSNFKSKANFSDTKKFLQLIMGSLRQRFKTRKLSFFSFILSRFKDTFMNTLGIESIFSSFFQVQLVNVLHLVRLLKQNNFQRQSYYRRKFLTKYFYFTGCSGQGHITGLYTHHRRYLEETFNKFLSLLKVFTFSLSGCPRKDKLSSECKCKYQDLNSSNRCKSFLKFLSRHFFP